MGSGSRCLEQAESYMENVLMFFVRSGEVFEISADHTIRSEFDEKKKSFERHIKRQPLGSHIKTHTFLRPICA